MNSYHCLICDKSITPKVYHDSLIYYDVPLCFPHRRMIDESRATAPAMKLYFALRLNKIPVILNYKQETKIFDIALPGQLNIDMNSQVQQDADQAFRDLFGEKYSLKENIPTIRIPGSLIIDELRFSKVLNRIIEVCSELKKSA